MLWFSLQSTVQEKRDMQRTKPEDARAPYEAPVVVELGSLHELTLQVKDGPTCDTSCFHTASISPG